MKPVLAAAFFWALMPFIKRFLFVKKTVIASHIKNSKSFQQGRLKYSVPQCQNEDNNGQGIQRLLRGEAVGALRMGPLNHLQGLCRILSGLWRAEELGEEALFPFILAFYANVSDHEELFLNLQVSDVLRKWVDGTNSNKEYILIQICIQIQPY